MTAVLPEDVLPRALYIFTSPPAEISEVKYTAGAPGSSVCFVSCEPDEALCEAPPVFVSRPFTGRLPQAHRNAMEARTQERKTIRFDFFI